MSFELSKPLNPEAGEWRPTKILQYDRRPNVTGRHSQIICSIMYTPHLQSSAVSEPVVAYLADMAAFSAYFHCYPAYYDQRVLYYLPPSGPLENGFCERVTIPFVNGDKESDGKQKVDEVDVMKEAARTNFHPRFRRHGRPFCFLKKSPSKLNWRPRKLVRFKTEILGDERSVGSQWLQSSEPITRSNSPVPNTTVMIKNIPNQLRRDYMLNFLDHYCSNFSLEYDFLYLPMDFRKWGNLGYGFVNFTTAVAAVKFMEILKNFKWESFQTERGSFTSKKICEITWAKIQGKEGYVRRFQHYNFACDQLEFLPVLLDPPRNGSDPNPHPPVILGNLMPPRFLRKKQ
ncbi:uncharacterized protein [Primulina eburnea]|uniref:uncharacterized protein n=1 Tax=Primulina eburnea TaxID=1245227 RepID=UPI003C6CC2C2